MVIFPIKLISFRRRDWKDKTSAQEPKSGRIFSLIVTRRQESVYFGGLKVPQSNIHPSIFYFRLIQRRVLGDWSLSRPVHHRATQRQMRHTTHARSEGWFNFETLINLTCMFLDGGRKPEYPERTHAYTGRTCQLHTERTSRDSNQWGDGADHHTTVQPHNPT